MLLSLFMIQAQFGYAQVQEPISVSVRLEQKRSNLRMHGMGLIISRISMATPLGFATIEISRAGGKWKFQVRESGLDRVYEISSERILLRGENLKSAFRSYPNRLVLLARGSSFDVLSEMPFSDYLAGVLAGEMPLAWPEETLKAQAIAARSYALAVMEKKCNGFLESTVMDQVFRWPLSAVDFKKAKKIVLETKGIVLHRSTGAIAKAYYHADCGGQTEREETVWHGRQTRQKYVALDESCQLRSPKWSLRLSNNLMRSKLRPIVGIDSASQLQLEFLWNGQRVSSVKVINDKKVKQISSDEFRHLIGVSELRSTLFKVEKDSSGWVFRGRGYGHGVGMCQWGSRVLAEQGYSAKQILAHYYPDLRVD